MNERLEYRMYGLVPYNISPIQQAIQYGHAIQEYNNNFFARADKRGEAFAEWRCKDKTFIILNGGTTNKQPSIVTGEPFGTLNQHLLKLIRHQIPTATFMEPDLGDQLTAVVFLVDERVFDKEKYPEFRTIMEEKFGGKGALQSEIRRILKGTSTSTKPTIESMFSTDYLKWCITLGNAENVFLREFLRPFKLA